jgi:DNA mismatch endonuclease (patch repair protein)
MGYRFRLHQKDLPGSPDIVLKKYKTVVFVHGCYWHGHDCRRGHLPEKNQEFWAKKIQTNQARDKASQEALLQIGWKPIVVWGCETGSKTKIELLSDRLSQEIGT